jgi:protein TonB
MKHNTLVFPGIIRFDVFELKKAYAKNFSLGMTTAVLIHILFVGVYYFFQSAAINIESKPTDHFITLTDPPPINYPVDPHITVTSSGANLRNAVPIPVPDDRIVDDKLIPTQNDLSRSWTQHGDANEGGLAPIPPETKVDIPQEKIPDMDGFSVYEKAPEIIKAYTPGYPELARRAGLEGTVYVKILVGKDGKPLKAIAYKFDSEIFVKPSIDAAMKTLFTPAIQQKAPVMVWITVPFKFRLNN